MIYLRHLFLGLTLAVLATGTGRANDLFNNNPLPGSLIDLSDDGNAPTFLTFSDGHNIVEGSMGWNGSTLDADIWTFTVAAGYEVSEINLVTYNGSNPTFPNGHFMALASGSTINTTDATNHLSNGLWREETDLLGNTKTDLLAILQAGPEFGGIGLTGNLQAGTYTFWVQDTTDFVNQYCIDFVITPVPEPGSALLLGAASLVCLRRRRPRK
jgi:hypothetical protein